MPKILYKGLRYLKILLIAGHGAGDVGAVGNGFKEADLTREMVNLIEDKLKAYASVSVYPQTRNAVKDVRNGRFSIGKYDYALEVHFNAFNGKAKGTEIFVTDREKGTGVEKAIMQHMEKHFTVRGVKVKNFRVINTIKNKGISSALLEVCFIDNASDMTIYKKNKTKIAQSIVDGIVQGFKLKPIKPMKSIDEIAHEAILGRWGVGVERVNSLKAAGYDPKTIQARVNAILK